MPAHGYTYAATLAAAQKANWRIEDILADRGLDFARPFLPESLARAQALEFLDSRERVTLNQIRGHGYLYVFGLVEEFILPFVMDHARATLDGDGTRTRALLQFAGEEAKHIDLFKRFRRAFLDGFGTDCTVIGPPAEIAKAVLAHHPLSVALLTLHIEWMTQRHYLDSIKDDGALDPHFKSLLKHHWMEEAQHARLDTLMVEQIAAGAGPDAIDRAVDGYLQLGMMIDGGLQRQTAFDLEALQRATGRMLADAERARFLGVQLQAMRWTFIGSGMTHPNFLATLGALSPASRRKVEEISPAFS